MEETNIRLLASIISLLFMMTADRNTAVLHLNVIFHSLLYKNYISQEVTCVTRVRTGVLHTDDDLIDVIVCFLPIEPGLCLWN